MKYTKPERMEIGRRVCDGELTIYMAAAVYDINYYTARDYAREYKALRALREESDGDQTRIVRDRARYEKMSKEELIDELIRIRFPGA